jgi:peptidoglycan/xylan/chitin deacetylase (PgdA/CDA1 family)
MVVKFSFDDGHAKDMKIALLLEQYGFRGTFYIPVHARQLDNNDIVRLHGRGHEIGGHTITHPMDMKLCDDDTLRYELTDGKLFLEEIIGEEVTSFAYPRGRFDDRVKEAVKQAGFKEARTVRVGTTTAPTDMFEIETTIHLYPRKEYGTTALTTYFQQKLEEAKENGYFHLWGHAKEFDELELWHTFEQMLLLTKEALC